MDGDTKIEKCKRDNTNSWVRSTKADGFVCVECAKYGVYGKEVFTELKNRYKREFKGVIYEDRYARKDR